MGNMLIVGLLFWLGITFFGTRKLFVDGCGPLCGFFRGVKRKAAWVLWCVAGTGLLAAGFLVFQEIAAVNRQAGMIGPLFFLAVVTGILGTVALSAQLFLTDGSAGDEH